MNVYEKDKVKYAYIFNQRGLDYHKAMLMLPNSRDNEFTNIVNQVEYSSEMTIIDMPSGGNYLKSFLPTSVKVIPLETSSVFANKVILKYAIGHIYHLKTILLTLSFVVLLFITCLARIE